jgi:nucleoside-diphosphate-sugar epimerase
MIIGNGLIAKALKDKDGITYFASGVSNSNETRQSEFDREEKLLRSVKSPIVYFSTTPKNDNPYILHKRKMESIVKESKDYTILRVQYICGNGGNPTNLFNFLKTKIKNKEHLTLYNCYRYLLDVEDLANMVPLMKFGTHTINGIEAVKVVDIAEMIAERYRVRLKYTLTEVHEEKAFNDYNIDKLIEWLKIERNGYTQRLITKYC